MTFFSRLRLGVLVFALGAELPAQSFANMLTDDTAAALAPVAQADPTLPALLPMPTIIPVQAAPALAEIANPRAAASMAAAPSAPAEEKIVVADAAPLSTDEMNTVRGGFADPTGMIRLFFVNVKTQLNGSTVFERSLVVAPSSTGQLQASANNDMITQNVPASFTVNMLGNGNGVSVTNAAGTTTILNQTTSGAPSSIIFNSASDRNVAQSVNLSLILQNTAAMTSNIRNANQAAAMAQHSAVRGIGL
jgi:hypothetical protein